MADTYVILPDDTINTGKHLDNTTCTTGAGTVYRQGVLVCDPSTALRAGVKAPSSMGSDEVGIMASVALLRDMAESLKEMNRVLATSLGAAGDPVTGKMRAACDINASQTLSTVTSVTTVSTVTSISQIATIDAKTGMLDYFADQDWVAAVRARIS